MCTQEWALVFIASFLFFIGAESYKFCKRAFFRRRAKKLRVGDDEDGEGRVFARYLSTDTSDCDEKGKV